ncbi:hypothetical protein QR680_019330 [Steinernema hermaphroditum]|uniref:Uncharacterized protein n=1 Tax=Steinernema hermaphroditum TaxID=289476 RepID=A0AA39GN07_9BILA|nr:hypothetical protein QR680_019330 [Steinernema hermaphroditum]
MDEMPSLSGEKDIAKNEMPSLSGEKDIAQERREVLEQMIINFHKHNKITPDGIPYHPPSEEERYLRSVPGVWMPNIFTEKRSRKHISAKRKSTPEPESPFATVSPKDKFLLDDDFELVSSDETPLKVETVESLDEQFSKLFYNDDTVPADVPEDAADRASSSSVPPATTSSKSRPIPLRDVVLRAPSYRSPHPHLTFHDQQRPSGSFPHQMPSFRRYTAPHNAHNVPRLWSNHNRFRYPAGTPTTNRFPVPRHDNADLANRPPFLNPYSETMRGVQPRNYFCRGTRSSRHPHRRSF